MRTPRYLFIGATVAAAVLLPVAGAQGAGAAAGPAVTQWVNGVVHEEPAYPSVNNGGYEVPTLTKSLTATVTLHALTCPATGNLASDLSVQDDGTLSNSPVGMASQINFGCVNGAASYTASLYSAAIYMPATFALSPGDKLKTTITVVPGKKQIGTLEDVTTKHAITITTPLSGPVSNLGGWAMLQNSETSLVPPFGKFAWSGVKADGATLKASSPNEYTLVNIAGKTLAKTSAIGAGGTSFSLTFVKS